MVDDDDDVRSKLEDLEFSLSDEDHHWTGWEAEFIESVCRNLSLHKIDLSPKHHEIICDLWERI